MLFKRRQNGGYNQNLGERPFYIGYRQSPEGERIHEVGDDKNTTEIVRVVTRVGVSAPSFQCSRPPPWAACPYGDRKKDCGRVLSFSGLQSSSFKCAIWFCVTRLPSRPRDHCSQSPLRRCCCRHLLRQTQSNIVQNFEPHKYEGEIGNRVSLTCQTALSPSPFPSTTPSRERRPSSVSLLTTSGPAMPSRNKKCGHGRAWGRRRRATLCVAPINTEDSLEPARASPPADGSSSRKGKKKRRKSNKLRIHLFEKRPPSKTRCPSRYPGRQGPTRCPPSGSREGG